MDSVTQPPAGPDRMAPHLVVALDDSLTWRVEEPARVMRIWSMLNAADAELHAVTLPPRVVARLQGQLDTITADLDRSLSPALSGELQRVTGRNLPAVPTTPDDLRVQYASLLGWLGAVVLSMLGTLQTALTNRPSLGRDTPGPARLSAPARA